MKSKQPGALKDGDQCTVIGGTHEGKSGIVQDMKTSATGHVTITVLQANGVRFKTLARNVVVGAAPARGAASAKKAPTAKAPTAKAPTRKAAAKKAAAKPISSKKTPPLAGRTPGMMIDARIKDLGDWRGEMLARLRAVVQGAHADVVEEFKWNVPVWSCDGIICTGETYKAAVKLTFAKGASLADPAKLFNSSLEGNTRRAIDFRSGDTINEKALKALVRAAVTLNRAKGKA